MALHSAQTETLVLIPAPPRLGVIRAEVVVALCEFGWIDSALPNHSSLINVLIVTEHYMIRFCHGFPSHLDTAWKEPS
jgi:hypothetical protein